MSALQTQWAWLLQLTQCLEKHLKHTPYYQQFYQDIKDTEAWLNKQDELMNSVYSQSEFTLDEGERLLKGMQELREELNMYGEVVATGRASSECCAPETEETTGHQAFVCTGKQENIMIEKGEQWVLHDNSGRVKWRVSRGSNSSDCSVPGAVFLIPPPDKEAVGAVKRLKHQYERSLALWQRKQLRIFAAIKVVKSWGLAQFLAMGADQRNAIRKAISEVAGKLLTEGDPVDPQVRRLKREMDEVNRLFNEFEALEEGKNAARVLTEQLSSLQTKLYETGHTLNLRLRLSAPVPRDLDSLKRLVIQHKDFETNLKSSRSLVIFDFDETLIQHNTGVVLTSLVPKENIRSNEEVYNYYLNKNWNPFLNGLLKMLKDDGITNEDLIERIKRLPATTGMPELLLWLRRNSHYDVIVVSDCNETFITEWLSHNGLLHTVQRIYANTLETSPDGLYSIQTPLNSGPCPVSLKPLCKSLLIQEHKHVMSRNGIKIFKVIDPNNLSSLSVSIVNLIFL